MREGYWEESDLSTKLDGPTKCMLDLWHTSCGSCFAEDIPVLFGQTHYNTTEFMSLADKTFVVVVWLTEGENAPPLLISHEIGHRVLELDGFLGLRSNLLPGDWPRTAGMLVSLAQHVPLYDMQKQLGHEQGSIQRMIDDRVEDCLLAYAGKPEPIDEAATSLHALLFADDIPHCSVQLRNRI